MLKPFVGVVPLAPLLTVVFSDDFETSLGRVTNPNGTDTATTGMWERGNPEATDSGGAKQLGTTTSADFLRVSVIGTTTSVLFQRVGSATNLNGAWAAASANLTPFAGQTIRLLIEAADAGTASLVEAGIDDVRITRQ